MAPVQSHLPPTPPAEMHTGSGDPGEHGTQMAAKDTGSTPQGYVPGTGSPVMGWVYVGHWGTSHSKPLLADTRVGMKEKGVPGAGASVRASVVSLGSTKVGRNTCRGLGREKGVPHLSENVRLGPGGSKPRVATGSDTVLRHTQTPLGVVDTSVAARSCGQVRTRDPPWHRDTSHRVDPGLCFASTRRWSWVCTMQAHVMAARPWGVVVARHLPYAPHVSACWQALNSQCSPCHPGSHTQAPGASWVSMGCRVRGAQVPRPEHSNQAPGSVPWAGSCTRPS